MNSTSFLTITQPFFFRCGSYWLRRLGLVQNSMGATLAERKDTSNSSSIAAIAEENVDPHALTSAAKLASREKRNMKRTSRALAARCLSPLLKGNVECRAAGEGGGTSPADASGLVSQDRRRHLMSQLTGTCFTIQKYESAQCRGDRTRTSPPWHEPQRHYTRILCGRIRRIRIPTKICYDRGRCGTAKY